MPCLETESTSWLKVIAAIKLALPRYTNLYALIELQYSMQDQAMSKGVQVCMPQTLTVFCGELDNVCRCTNLYATSRSYRVHSLGNTISCFRSASSCFSSEEARNNYNQKHPVFIGALNKSFLGNCTCTFILLQHYLGGI